MGIELIGNIFVVVLCDSKQEIVNMSNLEANAIFASRNPFEKGEKFLNKENIIQVRLMDLERWGYDARPPGMEFTKLLCHLLYAKKFDAPVNVNLWNRNKGTPKTVIADKDSRMIVLR